MNTQNYNAYQEHNTIQEDNFIRLLWKISPYYDLQNAFRVPDTLIFTARIKEFEWYFTSRSGKVMRKKQENCSIVRVKKKLLDSGGEIVQQRIQNGTAVATQYYLKQCAEDEQQKQQIVVKHLDVAQLCEMLVAQEKNKNQYDFVLQQHLTDEDSSECKEQAFITYYTPYHTYSERRENNYQESVCAEEFYKKIVTFEAPQCVAPSFKVSSTIQKELARISQLIAMAINTIYAREKGSVKRLELVMKKKRGIYWLLDCANMQFEKENMFNKIYTMEEEQLKGNAPLQPAQGTTVAQFDQYKRQCNIEKLALCAVCGKTGEQQHFKEITQNNVKRVRVLLSIPPLRSGNGFLKDQLPSQGYINNRCYLRGRAYSSTEYEFVHACQRCYEQYLTLHAQSVAYEAEQEQSKSKIQGIGSRTMQQQDQSQTNTISKYNENQSQQPISSTSSAKRGRSASQQEQLSDFQQCNNNKRQLSAQKILPNNNNFYFRQNDEKKQLNSSSSFKDVSSTVDTYVSEWQGSVVRSSIDHGSSKQPHNPPKFITTRASSNGQNRGESTKFLYQNQILQRRPPRVPSGEKMQNGIRKRLSNLLINRSEGSECVEQLGSTPHDGQNTSSISTLLSAKEKILQGASANEPPRGRRIPMLLN